MKITLHDESIDVEVGQKVIFYEYYLSDSNELEVKTDETYVDVIDKEANIIGFKNDDHVSILQFYQRDFLGERFFLNDTKENRLRFLKSKVAYYESKQNLIDSYIEENYKLIENYIKQKEDIKNTLESFNQIIEQLRGE